MSLAQIITFAALAVLLAFAGPMLRGLWHGVMYLRERMPSVSGAGGIFQAIVGAKVSVWYVAALAVLWFAVGGMSVEGCKVPNIPWPVIGQKPPFETDRLSVLVVEESSAHRDYTADQLNVIQSTDAKSVKAAVEGRGGRFEVIDKDVTEDRLSKADGWVRAAFAVKRDSVPWVHAATPRRGFSVPLKTEADLHSRLGGL